MSVNANTYSADTSVSLLLDIMVTMGFSREEIHESLVNQKYDEVMATYLLLGRKPPEVSAVYNFWFRLFMLLGWMMFLLIIL